MERTIGVACETLANREGSECEETVKQACPVTAAGRRRQPA
jgi:hypothetical protein